MIIQFRTTKLKKLCNDFTISRRELGEVCARKLRTRLDELDAAECLEHIRYIPPARCHELKGKLQGILSVDLEHPFRLLFKPAHNPVPQKADGGLNWNEVTAIIIEKVEDTHG